MDLQMFNAQPLRRDLSGLPLEYRIIQVYSRDAGRREAKFTFNVGQGTQDLGFRNEVDVLFTAERAPAITLEIREPGRGMRRVPMTGAPMRIGRAPECELELKDNRVSRRHARLAPRDGVLILTDLGSTNGTRVNGHRVTEVVLGAGDRVQIGETSLVVETAGADADADIGADARP